MEEHKNKEKQSGEGGILPSSKTQTLKQPAVVSTGKDIFQVLKGHLNCTSHNLPR